MGRQGQVYFRPHGLSAEDELGRYLGELTQRLMQHGLVNGLHVLASAAQNGGGDHQCSRVICTINRLGQR